MSETFEDIGYREPEPDESLFLFLVAHPEFRETCKQFGWWLSTIQEIEAK